MMANTQRSKRTIAYLCLQRTAEGQASHAHVHEIINGLILKGWGVRLYEPRWKSRPSIAGFCVRIIEFAMVQLRFCFSIRGFDAVYVREHFCLLPAVMVARALKKPVVIENNGTKEDVYIAYPSSRKLSFAIDPIRHLMMHLASAMISVTPQLAEDLRRENKNIPVHVVPNGANVELFKPHAACTISLPRQYALFFGALTRWHDLPTILAAAKDDSWPGNLDLVIAGNGVERPLVEQAMLTNPRIRYLGVVPYREIAGVVANSAVVLVTGCNLQGRASSGLSPLKLFEAMSSGVPVIVTDVPGQSDVVIACRCGLVIPAEDPKALAMAVARLASDPELSAQMGELGRRAAVEQFSWSSRAKGTSDILDSVMA